MDKMLTPSLFRKKHTTKDCSKPNNYKQPGGFFRTGFHPFGFFHPDDQRKKTN